MFAHRIGRGFHTTFIHLNLMAFLLTLGSSCLLNPPPFDEAAWRTKVQSADPALLYAPHFKDDRFFNPWMPGEDKGFFTLLRWRLTASQQYTEEEKTYLPHVQENAKERILAMPQGDFIMWVGHATFLIRLNSEYWLIDPIFSERALVVKRKTPPGITATITMTISTKAASSTFLKTRRCSFHSGSRGMSRIWTRRT
jgi:N-acyl-phosphatidylethanolamine-hydrolysing phospholipase D